MRWLILLLGLYPVASLEKIDGAEDVLNVWWRLEGLPAKENWAITYQALVWHSGLPGHCSWRQVEGELAPDKWNELVVGEEQNGHRRCRELIRVWLAPPYLGCQIYHLHNKQLQPALFGNRVISFSNEQQRFSALFSYEPRQKLTLSPIPEDRLDSRRFLSSPDALYLADEIPGYHFFRFRDVMVEGNQEIVVQFNYYLEGEGLRVRLRQYHDSLSEWKQLDVFDESLPATGRWTKFEEMVRLHPETTHIALDFRLTESSYNEAWIDDVEITQQDPYLVPSLDYRQWYRPLR